MSIKRVPKKILIIFTILILISSMNCIAKANIISNKILIIASYSSDNMWENSIIDGIKSSLGDEYIVKVEFLDSKSLETQEYDESFLNLLNVKYDNEIDYVIALDDEAFELVRKNLFNEELFTYKKPVIFAGVNNYITLSKEESEYITGVLEYQDNLLMINTILTAGNEIDDIYLLLDKSIYSYTIRENVKQLVNAAKKPYKVHCLEEIYIDDIIDDCKKINDKNSAIYLCGVYKDINTNEFLSPHQIVNDVKEATKAPIYTKLEEYIEAGAIGGLVNDGYKLGIVTVSILNNIMNGNNIYSIVPPHDTFSKPIFNYKAIREYNINPLRLPADSTYINKKIYNLLLPNYMIMLIYLFILLSAIGILLLIYLILVNKRNAKKNKLLLVESMEREKIKTDFIVTISHELRTPLNIIINATNLLKIKVHNNDFNEMFFNERLDYITKNANRLRRYINNLIDVSRLEMGYMDASFSNENIVSVVEEVTLTIVDLAKSFNIDIVFDTEEEEIITAIDKVKIERVMLNLLSNSIKFTKDNGTIMVLVKRKDNNVIIKVSDNGIGIAEEIKNHIFEKFKRADLNDGLVRQNEGSGLGLFIVKGIIELHKGEIVLDSKLNEGTTITITLPITIVDNSKSDDMMGAGSLEYMIAMEFSDIDKKE